MPPPPLQLAGPWRRVLPGLPWHQGRAPEWSPDERTLTIFYGQETNRGYEDDAASPQQQGSAQPFRKPLGNGRNDKGQFVAGHVGMSPGRPKGSKDKRTIEAQQLAARLVDDPDYRKKLLADMRVRKVAPAIEVMLWHYAYGKPKDMVEVDMFASSTTIDLDAIEDMSTAELEAARLLFRKILHRE